MYAVSFVGIAPEPQRGFQFLRSKRTSFSPEFENAKALIPACITHAKKYEQIDKHARI